MESYGILWNPFLESVLKQCLELRVAEWFHQCLDFNLQVGLRRWSPKLILHNMLLTALGSDSGASLCEIYVHLCSMASTMSLRKLQPCQMMIPKPRSSYLASGIGDFEISSVARHAGSGSEEITEQIGADYKKILDRKCKSIKLPSHVVSPAVDHHE